MTARASSSRRVRNALGLRAVGDALAVLDFDPAANGILELVRKAIAPDDPNPLRAELYGLNVYATGGHFVPHKDTPRGADMLGTAGGVSPHRVCRR